MNIISKFWTGFCNWVDGWPPTHVAFFMQATLLLGLPTLFCAILFRRGSRSVFVQVLALAVSVLLAASIRADDLIPRNAVAKSWLVVLCFVLLLFLPAILPRVLTPQLGTQRRLQTILYFILIGMFVMNLLAC